MGLRLELHCPIIRAKWPPKTAIRACDRASEDSFNTFAAMLTPRRGSGGVYQASNTSGATTITTKKPCSASHEDDLRPHQCMSPDHNDVYQDALVLCKQQLMSPTANGGNSNSSQADTAQQPDAALMDFWLLLQQTQSNLQVRAALDQRCPASVPLFVSFLCCQYLQNLNACKLTPLDAGTPSLSPFLPYNNCVQDMLVDLETAKVELDLANERANEAQQQAGSLKVQLAASEQRCQVLEAQLQTTQKK